MSERELLNRTAEIAADFLETLGERSVWPPADVDELRTALGGPLPDGPGDPTDVIEALSEAAERGVVGIPSGRYFGFVIGGALPAALAADWLTSTWDQNAGLVVCGPAAAVVEEVVGDWLKDLLRLPRDASFALVTGCQMAHTTCLAAARHSVLARAGWDVERDGLATAPQVRVLASAKRHSTIDRSLRLLGLGTASVTEIPADGQGRMVVGELASTLGGLGDGPTIVCAQAGEVNTGSFDDLEAIADLAEAAGAWLHVDGAFGLWAAASPRLRSLIAGAERADSWATDAHKWLNVPYDCGIAFVADPKSHRAAMAVRAAYLVQDEAARDQMDWTPEFSRRARGFAVYAALRSLGRQGVAALVESSCDRARQFAEGMARLPGCEILNDVVLNQVLFRFEDDGATSAALAAVQDSGEAWMSGTAWEGRSAIRLSVSNWRTSERDIEQTVAAFEAALVVS